MNTFKTTLLYILISCIASKASAQKPQDTKIHSASLDKKQTYTYKITNAPEKTFVYDVYENGKLLIHQTSIPAVAGNKGFKTKAQATKVAKLVISKLQAGEMPPSITVEELNDLKVL